MPDEQPDHTGTEPGRRALATGNLKSPLGYLDPDRHRNDAYPPTWDHPTNVHTEADKTMPPTRTLRRTLDAHNPDLYRSNPYPLSWDGRNP